MRPGAGALFIGSSCCDSQLLESAADFPPSVGQQQTSSHSKGINNGESTRPQPLHMMDPRFIFNPSPIHHSITLSDELDELQGTSGTAGALLLCCGKSPRGSLRLGQMAVKLVSRTGRLALLQVHHDFQHASSASSAEDVGPDITLFSLKNQSHCIQALVSG